jgi:outer membrane protein OmpA-like peptidoglycan-associated protein
MRVSVICCWLAWLAASVLPWSAQAMTYKAEIENTEWQLEPTIFGCKFRQPIPYFGFAVFFREAGEDLQFYLETTNNEMRAGQSASVIVEAPEWWSSKIVNDLGGVTVKDYRYPVVVNAPRSLTMLDGLRKGMSPTVTRQTRYDEDMVRVQVSPIRFSQYYNDYLACVAGLLPVNFRQVERMTLNFDAGQDGLDELHRDELNTMVKYVLADPKVMLIYIDGHTDDQGTRYENRRLSEKRANQVEDYLIGQGITPDLIVTRYHGERYPVETNNTAAGRAENRRVTLRLERIFGEPDDPLNRHPVFK